MDLMGYMYHYTDGSDADRHNRSFGIYNKDTRRFTIDWSESIMPTNVEFLDRYWTPLLVKRYIE